MDAWLKTVFGSPEWQFLTGLAIGLIFGVEGNVTRGAPDCLFCWSRCGGAISGEHSAQAIDR